MIEHQFNVAQAIWLEGLVTNDFFHFLPVCFLVLKNTKMKFLFDGWCLFMYRSVVKRYFGMSGKWSELNRLLNRLSSFTIVKSGQRANIVFVIYCQNCLLEIITILSVYKFYKF